MIRIIIRERKELIQELDINQVKERFNSKGFLKAHKNSSLDDWTIDNIQRFVVSNFIPKDIQEKDKATVLNWLIGIFIKNPKDWVNYFEYDVHDMGPALETFFQIKEQNLDRFLKVKDINQIGSFRDFKEIVNTAKPLYKKHLETKVNKTQAQAGQKLIFSNDAWDVYIPETKAAACALGKGTDWCTAAPGLDYYENYHKENDPLIIFKNKSHSEDDVQMHFGTGQFMDVADRQIDDDDAVRLATLLKGNKYLPKEILNKVNDAGFKDFGDGRTYVAKFDGTKQWLLNGELHREDGPAIEAANGTKHWCLNGKLHREDGPAVERANGTKQWFLNGKLHREDGPAIEAADGSKQWCLNGELHREDGPAIEWADGNKEWFLNGLECGYGRTPPNKYLAALAKLKDSEQKKPLKEWKEVRTYFNKFEIF
jgi:hypothetical protein